MKRTIFVTVAALLLCASGFPQTRDKSASVTDQQFRVYRGDGTPATLTDVVAAARTASVTFLGEQHDDRVAHHLEFQILKGLTSPRLILALEMFERDVQTVVDEYLSDLITEDHLISAGRAPRNYRSDYRPLVDHARQNGVPVLASNAPRRYVNRVSRLGKEALASMPEKARATFAPLPYPDATSEYAERFQKVMEEADKEQPAGQPPRNPVFSLQAQSLWDATMAFSIAEALTRRPDAQVLHINGAFHTERRQGILDHLVRYRPGTAMVVVTMLSHKDFPRWVAAEMRGVGDFVIVTQPADDAAPTPKERK